MTPLTLICTLMLAQTVALPTEAEGFTQELAGTTLSIEMLPIPGRIDDPNKEFGLGPGFEIEDFQPFYMSRLEITWDLYDVFVYGYDLPRDAERTGEQADGVTRPTRPYIAADHGFGHAGYPVISVSHRGAEAYCAWLRHKTGRNYRLPTQWEWEWAARAEWGVTWTAGEEELRKYAWVRDNSRRKTHPVGELLPNAWGLHDVLGNVAEWCTKTGGSGYVLRGGSYVDRAEKVDWQAYKDPTPAWNANDPQIPKSIWWLTDGSFAGFRVVCDMEGDEPASAPVEPAGEPVPEPATSDE